MEMMACSSDEKVLLDFQYFIKSAIQEEISWKSLAYFLTDLATTLNQSKQVIRVLVKELEKWVSKAEIDRNNFGADGILQSEGEEKQEYQRDDEKVSDNDVYDTAKVEMFETDNLVDGIEMETNLDHVEKSVENEIADEESNNRIFENNIDKLDNEWYTFVGNDGSSDNVDDEQYQSNDDGIQDSSEKSQSFDDAELSRFSCKICDKHCTSKGSLEEHQNVHSNRRPFQCKLCNKFFKKLSTLKIHTRIHTGVAPYECEICKKRFKQSNGLRWHERIHTGESPYECKTCSKRFNQKGNLIKHEKLCSGVVPYQCQICQRKFKTLGTLKTHEMMHDKRKGERL